MIGCDCNGSIFLRPQAVFSWTWTRSLSQSTASNKEPAWAIIPKRRDAALIIRCCALKRRAMNFGMALFDLETLRRTPAWFTSCVDVWPSFLWDGHGRESAFGQTPAFSETNSSATSKLVVAAT